MLEFQKHSAEFESRKIKIIAASTDPQDKAAETVNKYGITFAVGYGLSPAALSAASGAFFNPEKNFLHATGFIINPDARIENAVYSSRSIGRLTAKDCLAFIKS